MERRLSHAKSTAQMYHLSSVKPELDEGEKLLLERQKHILLADKSESGFYRRGIQQARSGGKFWRRKAYFQCWKTRSIDFVHSEEEKEHLIRRKQKTFACMYIGSLYFNGYCLNSNLKPFSLYCPLCLRFVVPTWAVVLLVVNPGKPCLVMAEQQPPPTLKSLQDQDKSGVVNSILIIMISYGSASW